VSPFALDRFEVTVGRFRGFVAATASGWTPGAGSGKHAHLNNGAGLNGGTESGWDATWDGSLPSSSSDWDSALACGAMATWTSTAGANEDRPINCVAWTDAYAFCIWDGGFLPTEAEWNYAAAGGAEQRSYPWSVPATSQTIDDTYASYNCMGDLQSGCLPGDVTLVGAKSPKGDGKWGHADLAGDLWEWGLDWFLTDPPMPCVDCAAIQSGAVRAQRGGAWDNDTSFLLTSYRYNQPSGRHHWDGVRCARSP
jgi:formylglycine-generating enzyme required for sulfatase activity